MKTLVVGGAGFIGSHLCDQLLEIGHEVYCIDNFSMGMKNIAHLNSKHGFYLYEGDVADKEMLRDLFELIHPDHVFQMAANSDIQASAADPDVEYRNTYTTTYNILVCMREFHINKLFFASTSAVYGNKKDVILDENTPGLSPVSYYGAAKLGCEALINAFSYMNDMRALIFRFPNVIGPRLTHGVIYDFMHKLRRDPVRLEILGDGNQTKPYIYVNDLVQAIVRFSEMKQAYVEGGVSIYNLGVSGATSVKRIADILCEEMNLKNVSYEFTGGESGWKGDVPRFQYCLDKIHALGWEANYTSDEAVRKTIQELLHAKGQ